MSNAAAAYEFMKAQEGKEEGVGEWFEIDQERINQFADATLDHQFIHIDEEAAAATPFGGTIAHGFLTLSLLVHLDTTIKREETLPLNGLLMGVNYGLNKVRFINPVPTGSRVRSRAVVSDVQLKGTAIDQTRTITVELEGSDRPALIAEWIGRLVFDS